MEVQVQTPGAGGPLDSEGMKREEEEKEEEEEVLVSVEEEEACGTDIPPQDPRSVLAQGWGLHLVVKHLNCSRFSQHVQNIPQKTFSQVLYTCYSFCVLLSLLRIKYGPLTFSSVILFGLAGEFPLDCALLFAILATIVILTMDVKMKRRKKDSIPTLSATVHQV